MPDNNRHLGFIIGLICLFASSCSVVKPPATYFKTLKRDTTLQAVVKPPLDMQIKAGDILLIKISSLNPELDAYFNAASGVGEVGGYAVDQNGLIYIRKMGGVKAEGLTRKQLQNKLVDSLKPYLKDPLVNISFANHKVTVMGAVTSPQVLPMPDEQITIIDALAKTGDLKEFAELHNLTLIRENGNQKEIKKINLEDHSIFNSEYFYLRPNDVLIVGMDNEPRMKLERQQNLQRNLTLGLSVFSVLFIIIDRLTR